MKIIISILTIVILSSACSPVRYKVFNKKKKSGVMVLDSVDIHEEEENANTDPYRDYRFTDTTYIYIDADKIQRNLTMSDQFDEALKLFDEEKYDEACPAFKYLSTTFPTNDSLYFESFFYCAECRLLDENYEKAEEILKELLDNPKTPQSVMERCLVRLGQVYCVTDKKKKAKELFERLKKKYPQSIYLKIANCQAVE